MVRSVRLMVAAGVFAGAALTVVAQAAPPSEKPQPQQTKIVQRGPIPTVQHDLVCTIEVFRDAAATVAVSPGGSVVSGGGTVSAFVRLTVKNDSPIAKSDNVTAKLVSSSGSAPTSVMLPPVNLAAGATHSYPLHEFKYGAVSSNVTITGTVDPSNTVKETNETNNTCSFSFKEQTVH
jgi:hypothetical protein